MPNLVVDGGVYSLQDALPSHTHSSGAAQREWIEPRMRRFSRRQFLAATGAAMASPWIATPLPCDAAEWKDHRSYGPFQCHATFSLANFAPVFDELAAVEKELQRTLAVPPAGQSIDIYIVENEQTHRQLLGQLYPRISYRRALYVQRSGRGSVYAYLHPELDIDLRHECTHALLHSTLPMVPLWLDEGLAEYFEMPAAARAFDHPHFTKLRWSNRFGMIRDIESLEQCRSLEDMGPTEYRFAWAWVHFMLHGPLPAHRALVHFLADIRRGNPPGKLSERLQVALARPEKEMAKHFRNWHR